MPGQMAAWHLTLLRPAELVLSWSTCDSKGGVAAWLGVQQDELGELARKTNTGHQQLAFTNWDTPPKAVVLSLRPRSGRSGFCLH